MAGYRLIAVPLSLSFKAPFGDSQKRLITLFNLSDQDVLYRIHIGNDTDYSVDPVRGTLKAFDKTELTVSLAPVARDLPTCSLLVRSIPTEVFADEEDAEWNCTNVQIKLDPRKTPLPEDETRMQGADAFKINRHIQCECDMCSRKKPIKSGCKTILYILGIFAVIVAAYFFYDTARFSLGSERIF